MSERREGLLDELRRVERDLMDHRAKVRIVNEPQWLRHLARLLTSKADLLDAIAKEDAA